MIVANHLKRPTQTSQRATECDFSRRFLFGLAPSGVYHATPVTRSAVSSYLTLSPLPTGPAHISTMLVLSGRFFAIRCSCTSVYIALRFSKINHLSLSIATCEQAPIGGLLSVALAVGFRLPGVTWHFALRGPDFPLWANAHSDCLADSQESVIELLSCVIRIKTSHPYEACLFLPCFGCL